MRKHACAYAGLQSFLLLHLTRYKVKLKHWHKRTKYTLTKIKTDLPQYMETSIGIRMIHVICPSSVSKVISWLIDMYCAAVHRHKRGNSHSLSIYTAFPFNVGLLYLCNKLYSFFGNMHSLYTYRYGWEKIPVGHALQEKRRNMMDEMLSYSVSAGNCQCCHRHY